MEKTLVIIPTYNEAENIKKVIEATIREKKFDVLVVDDSSPDGTATIVKEIIKSYPKKVFLEVKKNKDGLGRAYIHGFKWAVDKMYDYIFEMDADFSHNPSELVTMLDYLKEGKDMVIGSRYIKGINVVNWPLGRIILSYLASVYVRLITSMPIKDPTAGFVGYQRAVLEEIIFTNRTLGLSKMDGGIIWEGLLGVLILRINDIFGLNK